METLKHECGVAMVRLLKPLSYYQQKYGTWMYGLNKLYLMMEKQHNRGQEGAGLACVKFDILPCYLLHPYRLGEYSVELFVRGNSSQGLDGSNLFFMHMFFEPLYESVECHLGSIGDERKDGMFRIAPNGFEYRLGEKFTQSLALLIDVPVRPSREIYALKRAGRISGLLSDALYAALSVALDQQSHSRFKLLNLLAGQIACRLKHGTFRSQRHNLIIFIIIGWTYSPRVSH